MKAFAAALARAATQRYGARMTIVIDVIGWLAIGIASGGIVYLLFAAATIRRFFARVITSAPSATAVTLLKPLYGAEPRLYDNLATFLRQTHAGPVQIVFGIQRAGDPAIGVVESLRAAYPQADIALVLDATAHGANAKVSNLVNMMAAVRHDVLVLSDSDIAVGPDYLARVLAALDAPGVGVVSCLYRGRGDAGFWSRFGAAGLSYQFVIGVVVAVSHRLADPCMGSTIALRRETLERIGGFARFADTLADDHALGQAVLATGQTLSVPAMFVTHAFDETSLSALWRHEVRWSATVRDIALWPYVGAVIGMPFPVALLTVSYWPAIGLALAAAALAARYVVVRAVDGAVGERVAPFALVPAHEVLSFAVWIASFFVRSVAWRGSTLRMRTDGRIAATEQDP